MQIIEKGLSEIIPYENNPRNNDNVVEAVANSIKEFGFKVPIVIDNDGVIVAGHTRYKAAERLGLKSVPCIVASDLTPKQVKAFRLADNKVGEQAAWDLEKLNIELDGLDDLDMSMFGFEFDEEPAGQTIVAGGEINTEDYSDDKFSCTCPKCGFTFNPKE